MSKNIEKKPEAQPEVKKELTKLSDFVTLNVKHNFSEDEILQKAFQLAHLNGDIESEELDKKASAAEFKNKIDKLKAEAKLISGHINNKFAFVDKVAELYLDYESNQRVFTDKQTGLILKQEPFHASDYQKKIEFEAREEQIDHNNEVGDYAEGESGSTDLKPVPKGNLPDNYGSKFEIEDDIDPEENIQPDEDGFYTDHNGNLTDIHPRDLVKELKDHPETVDINDKVKAKVDEFKKTKANSKRN